MSMQWTEPLLLAAAVSLGAPRVSGWTSTEELLIKNLPAIRSSIVDNLRNDISAGKDPLGEILCALRSAKQRREQGAIFTPLPIVKTMLSWARKQGQPIRVVDAGAGSARFMLEAGRQFGNAELIGCELDPIAAVIARGNLAAANLAHRARIFVGDYRELTLPPVSGQTFYTGNPPYVRHHNLDKKWKEWLITQARGLGLNASQLAGLHVHFFLSTVLRAQVGDFGSFITAAEWLDVNYGSLVRELFLSDLGGQRIVLIDPAAMPFPDATTTAAITLFEIGSRPRSISFKRVESLKDLSKSNSGRRVRREKLQKETRWSKLTRMSSPVREGFVELGEIVSVHRGQVTGANKIWIASHHSEGLPASVLFPTVTKAREIISAGLVLNSLSGLRHVIDIPADLSGFELVERHAIERFLKLAKTLGASESFIARNRKAWWSVGLREPAPILASYMARRPPAFVRNLASARHINIAHGLYPRESFTSQVLENLVKYLSEQTSIADGRTYAGGLTKFEPREMERILVPSPELLAN